MHTKESIKTQNMTQLCEYRQALWDNPHLVYLFAELTDCCNMNCLHCGSSCEPSLGHYLDTELLLYALGTVAEDFGSDKPMICLTGGEPLLHPDFFRIAEEIHRLGFAYGITTNGTLIDETTAALLKKNHLGSVSVSLDGTEKTHDALRKGKDSFRRAVRGIKNLQAQGIRVQITTVIHKKNYHELEDIFALAKELSVASWRVINIEPIGRALMHRELLLDRDEMMVLYDFIREKRYANDTPMDVCYGCSHYLSFDYEHELRDNYFLCGSGIYVASILYNGDIYSCLDIERRPELVQGNIARDRFSEVWKNGFRVFREDRSEKCERCRNCKERAFCAGDSTHTWNFDKNEPNFCILRDKSLYED